MDKNSSGDWNAGLNWTEAAFAPPNNPNHTAVFGDVIMSDRVVFTESPVTVNRIEFANTTSSYTIVGGSINMEATTDPDSPVNPSMSVQGVHQFQLEVNLLGNTEVDVASASSLTFNNALNLAGKTLTKTGAGMVVVNNQLNTGGGALVGLSGTIAGSGAVSGNLDNQSATVAPGNSPGVLSVTGDYTQGAAATLEIEVAGTGAGDDGHDQLAVGGTATLDGTLDIQTDASFTPAVGGMPGIIGDQFVILTADSVVDKFSTVNGNHLGAGHFYLMEYNPSDVTLSSFQAIGGDADGDKDVDITDFNTLAANFAPFGVGLDWTDGNFAVDTGDGDVDITDFNALAANFMPGGYGGSTRQVPEPTTIVLFCMLGLVGAGMFVRGKRR